MEGKGFSMLLVCPMKSKSEIFNPGNSARTTQRLVGWETIKRISNNSKLWNTKPVQSPRKHIYSVSWSQNKYGCWPCSEIIYIYYYKLFIVWQPLNLITLFKMCCFFHKFKFLNNLLKRSIFRNKSQNKQSGQHIYWSYHYFMLFCMWIKQKLKIYVFFNV